MNLRAQVLRQDAPRRRALSPLAVVLSTAAPALAAVLLAGCGGDGNGTPQEPTLLSIAVAPDSLVLPAVNARFQLTVTGTTSTGTRDLTADPATSYTSRAQSVASAMAGGSVVASGEGETFVLASNGGFTDSARVRVDFDAGIAIDSMSISPEAVALTSAGQTRATSTVVIWANGARFDGGGAPVVYASDAEGVATVGVNGVIVAVANGTTTIRATVGDRSDSVSVNVTISTTISFATSVGPVLRTNCTFIGCHSGPTPQRNLNLESYAGLMAGTSLNGPVVIPGDGAGSLIIQVLRGPVGDPVNAAQMPRGRTPLPAATIDTIEDWIDQGALNN